MNTFVLFIVVAISLASAPCNAMVSTNGGMNFGTTSFPQGKPKDMMNLGTIQYVEDGKTITEKVTDGKVYHNDQLIYTAPASRKSFCVIGDQVFVNDQPVFNLKTRTPIPNTTTKPEPKSESTIPKKSPSPNRSKKPARKTASRNLSDQRSPTPRRSVRRSPSRRSSGQYD